MQDLSRYGHTYQVKVLSSLLTDVQFTARAFDILLPEYFDDDAIVWLYELIRNYFVKHHILPTLDVIKHRIESMDDDDTVLKSQVVEVLREAWMLIESPDLEDIKETSINFCVDQSVRKVLFDSVDLVREGRYDEIKRNLDDALRKGAADVDDPFDYVDNIEHRYSETARIPIPTGFPVVDELTQGGLAPGELGVIAGPGGSGKSWLLQCISAGAVDAGHRVLYISLELSKVYVEIRHDMILTHMGANELKDNLDILKRRLSTLRGELEVKWYPTKKFTVIKLRAILDKMKLMERSPAVVVIDYPDLMKLGSDKNKRKDELLQDLYEELRMIAGEYQLPMWVASQTRRSSIKLDEIEADDISESMGKHYTSDFMMTISRKLEDKAAKSARFTIIKSRLGVDGLTLLGKMNTDKGIIEIYNRKTKATTLQAGTKNPAKQLARGVWNDIKESNT